jgi:hypothetical protein
LTFIYLNLDSGVAMHKKGLCKKCHLAGPIEKLAGRSVTNIVLADESLLFPDEATAESGIADEPAIIWITSPENDILRV